ncbi:MAG: glycine cleavage system aminomethyltransferase GcvT [Rhodospirillales bacterium]|nr:glycine cleavage system aminomethyltransferase GcvT [Rhodospirillales bacterium]MBO6785644.1 glycine cleavage system aminomethyltransferase GcvT [Rhodospirillales bacterium]
MGQDTGQPLKTVPLAAFHRHLGAKMVPFAGYEMPVQYPAGIIEEHKHTRDKAGLFDVSHMGQAWLHGADAAKAIEKLVPGDIQALKPGTGRYTMITNDDGGIVDDLIVTNWGDRLFIVVNASRKHIDLPMIAEAASGLAELEIVENRALIALQGPSASGVLSGMAPALAAMPFMSAVETDIGGIACHVTRSGYTGEDGYEISIPVGNIEAIAQALCDHSDVMPVGLGARDTLRLEAGLCLYGNDLDEETSPIEAGLAWTISKRRREAGDFPGAARILGELADGPQRKRVGIQPEGRAPARDGTVIHAAGGDAVGTITSGGFGPSAGGPIAMGYVGAEHAAPGTQLELAVRKNMVPASVVKMPFQPHRYYKG